MRLPVSFDDAWYFRREYRGDLVVTDGVLYYFPHTNATLERAPAPCAARCARAASPVERDAHRTA